jgi:protein SCO1/2
MYKVDGTILTNKDLLGTNHIVYFGFTRCPDACPTFMFKLTTALKYIS